MCQLVYDNEILLLLHYCLIRNHITILSFCSAFNLRALAEFRLGSKDCDLSKEYAQRAYDLGATVDTFIVSGTIWVECGDLKEGTKFFENALRLIIILG